jgi:formylglycine-generating enzyme required for sulfatase activity
MVCYRLFLAVVLSPILVAALVTRAEAQIKGIRITGCPPDSVEVGPLCVDKYEVSVWVISDPTVIEKVIAGQATLGDLRTSTQVGGTGVDYPCADNGNDCKGKMFAASIRGVRPSVLNTWFQAQQACANSGKQLPTSAEWQMAAAGTFDPGGNNGLLNAKCNTDSCSSGGACTLRLTGRAGATPGGTNSCLSLWGAEDMVGNVQEWVADWAVVASGVGCTIWPPGFGSDLTCMNDSVPTGFPAAIVRGGHFFNAGTGSVAGVFEISSALPSDGNFGARGFRCVRPKKEIIREWKIM